MRSRLKRSLKTSLAETNEGDLDDFSPELLEDYGEYNKSITSNKKTLTDSYVNAKNLQSVGSKAFSDFWQPDTRSGTVQEIRYYDTDTKMVEQQIQQQHLYPVFYKDMLPFHN
ncbi:Hypothetical predicted protein [Octopus vulgaris]|uniref:Uncharacterized protein n=1 Tax=Octopus vulgaris TaxID=6645 RepID=A0AA36F3M3_OCTVU|nr:Hypothetical predicted protein [Octopus vulgaris]